MAKGGLQKLIGASKKKAAPAKSSVPTVTATETLRPNVKAWVEAKRAENTAVSQRKEAEGTMVDEIQDLRVKQCRTDGQHYSSLRVNAGNDGSLKLTQKGQYKKMTSEEHEMILRRIFGDGEFERLFTCECALTVDTSTIEPKQLTALARILSDTGCSIIVNTRALSDAQADKLLDVLGDKAGDCMAAETTIKPNDTFTHDCVFNDKIAKLAGQAKSEGVAVPYAPSFSS